MGRSVPGAQVLRPATRRASSSARQGIGHGRCSQVPLVNEEVVRTLNEDPKLDQVWPGEVADVRRDDHIGSSSQGRRNHVPVMFGHAAGYSRHPSTNLSIGHFRVLERESHRGDPLRDALLTYLWANPKDAALRLLQDLAAPDRPEEPVLGDQEM